jgi:hypothetical protein
MGLLRRFGSIAGNVLRTAGSIGGKVLRAAGSVAQPVAGAVNAVIDALPIPGAVGGIAKNLVSKTADWISSGRASKAADRASRYGESFLELSGDGE